MQDEGDGLILYEVVQGPVTKVQRIENTRAQGGLPPMAAGTACWVLSGNRVKLSITHVGSQRMELGPHKCCSRVGLQVRRPNRRSYITCSLSGDSNKGQSIAPPQEAILKAISEVSKAEGRVAQTTNMILGGTVPESSDNEWNVIDQKVNLYPMTRGFTAIGIRGDDFVDAMVDAVESVLERPIPEGGVSQKPSARGKYVSVKIGPVNVKSWEQVRAVYDAMKRDVRMKYFF